MSGRRIGLVAWHVLKQNVRDRVLYSIAAFAMLLVGAAFVIDQMTAGQDLKIIKDLGLAAIELAGVLLSVFIGVSLVSHEIDRRSIFNVLSKPIQRWEFIVGKYAGLVLTLAMNVAALTGVLYLLLFWMGSTAPDNVRLSWEAPATDPRLLVSVALITAELALLTAIALFFSTFSSSAMLSAVLTVGLFIAGVESDALRQFTQTVDASAAGRLVTSVGWLVPAFSAFDVKTEVVHGLPIAAGRIWFSLAYAAIYAAVAVGAAVLRLLAAGIPMSRRLATFLGVTAIGVGLGLAATMLYASEMRGQPSALVERTLYLKSPQAVQRLSLGFDAVAADIYWIRAIQHFGGDRRSSRTTGRFELLHPLLDLTTTLDPHFNIAYRYGAILLALAQPEGPGRPDQAIALLEKGLFHNPDRWQFAYDIGFIHYFYTADYAAAGRWFEQAGNMPRAPSWILPLAATTTAKGGDRESARVMLVRLHESHETYIKRAAERGLLQLRALDEIDQLQGLVDRYAIDQAVHPESWIDLMGAGLLTAIPVDPAQVPYASPIRPRTG